MVYLVGTVSDLGDVLSNNVDALVHITANISPEAITVAAATTIFIPAGKTLVAENSIYNGGEIIIEGTLNIDNGTAGMDGYGVYNVSDTGSMLMGGQPYIAASGALKVSSGAIWLNQNTSGGATYVVPSGSEVVIQGANGLFNPLPTWYGNCENDTITVESGGTMYINVNTVNTGTITVAGSLIVDSGIEVTGYNNEDDTPLPSAQQIILQSGGTISGIDPITSVGTYHWNLGASAETDRTDGSWGMPE
jgi:hypothetical protein